MGSDWGVSTANVMEQIDVAVTRSIDGGPPLWPDQALTPEEALVAFTKGSAYVNRADRVVGRVSSGMLGDVVVFDRDPFTEGQFSDAEVALTLVGGEVVYER